MDTSSKTQQTESKLAYLEELVRSQGETATSVRLARELARAKLTREQALRLALWARIIYQANCSIQALHRWVRPRRTAAQPTDGEKAEYGAALVSLGASTEGNAWLSKASPEKHSLVWLFRAFSAIEAWEYDEAIANLQKLTQSEKDAHRASGWHWLSFSLTEGKLQPERAREAIVKARAIAQGHGNLRIVRSSSHVLARLELKLGNIAQSKAALAELLPKKPEDEGSLFSLETRTLEILIALKEKTIAPSRARDELEAIRAKIVATHQWDTYRLNAFHSAQALDDREAFIRLYFGSPFPKLRARVAIELERLGGVPESYDWVLSPGSNPIVVHIASGEIEGAGALKTGQLLQRALKSLAADLYKPSTLASLHEAMYPGDYFNPDSSPDRVHQALARLRTWIEERKLPLRVEEKDGFYSLKASRALVLRFVREDAPPPLPVALRDKFQALRSKLGDKSFSTLAASRALDLSDRSASRLLKDGVERGILDRVGSGSSTRYRFRQNL